MKNKDYAIYKQISDESMIALFIFDPLLACVYLNPLAQRLIEHSDESGACQIKAPQLFPTAETADKRIRKLSSETLQMRGQVQDILVKKLNGQNFIANIGIKEITIEGQLCILLMVQDITLQKKLQREITEKQTAINHAYQELLQQNKQLKELDVAKNRFIAMTTHELRTPLSAMVASAEIIKLKLYDDEAQREEFTNMIYDQGQHMLNLVNDILDFAKIQANKMDYYVEENELLPVLQSEVDNLQTMAEKSKVKLTILPSSESSKCYFDELRIRQVFTNLINNAIKYNKDNGEVNITLSADEDFIHVYIQDTGKGISPEDQPKVFNEFETLGKVANHAKGTGLGLPISLRMMQAMGGTIHLESTPGVGSKFWLDIPRKQVLESDNYRSRPDSSGDLAA